MNIGEAKNYIKDTVRMYLKKDEYGDYRIPVVRQRPVFLLGAPGIGKTAIMEQVAQELGIALVSYSMTHHTRQSALGLPFIEHKKYGGEEYAVSEYTMSEIIASVYETMEKSNIKEGILFLDEINCVSETLAPAMLQFLQYKVFGRHQVPEGWVIVTAGNPPEYNKSVREFDVVTLDRMKILEIEPDIGVWKAYAKDRRLHAAVTSYLDINKKDFYVMETTASGRSFVTARGWEDLSQILKMYEEDNLEVNESLVSQYLRNERVVREFVAYYDLYNKYKNDYKTEQILAGIYNNDTIEKARNASFDEKLSLVGLLINQLQGDMKDMCLDAQVIKAIVLGLKALKDAEDSDRIIDSMIETCRKKTESLRVAGSLSDDEKLVSKKQIALLTSMLGLGYEQIKDIFNNNKSALMEGVDKVKAKLHFAFEFIDKAFGEGNELLILLTELTAGKFSTEFLSSFGSDDFNTYSSSMQMTGRKEAILADISALDL